MSFISLLHISLVLGCVRKEHSKVASAGAWVVVMKERVVSQVISALSLDLLASKLS